MELRWRTRTCFPPQRPLPPNGTASTRTPNCSTLLSLTSSITLINITALPCRCTRVTVVCIGRTALGAMRTLPPRTGAIRIAPYRRKSFRASRTPLIRISTHQLGRLKTSGVISSCLRSIPGCRTIPSHSQIMSNPSGKRA